MKYTLSFGDMTNPSREMEIEFVDSPPPIPALGEHVGVEFDNGGDTENCVVSYVHKQYYRDSIWISVGVVPSPTNF